MRVEVDHTEIQELLGVYALNAVDATEAAIVESHLTACLECAEELAQYREVASLLSATGKFAPAELWETIVSRLADDAQPAASDTATPMGDAVVHPLWRRRVRPVAAAAAAVLIVGAAGVQSARLSVANTELSAVRVKVAALTEQIERAPLDVAASRALAASASRRFVLDSEATGSNAIIVLMPDGTGYLTEHTLQPLPPDRTYQLWAIVDGKVISAGVLGSEPAVVPFRIDPEGFAGFAITEEVAGGVEASQNDPVAIALEA